MESVACLSPAEHRDLFAETAVRKGMTPAIVEKDFWVCWTLGRLFAHPGLSRLLMFKGGTSLSKVFNLIERFSEDIDLILDWRVVVGDDDPLAERSATKQEALNKIIEAKAIDYIGCEMLEMISLAVDPVCSCELATDDLQALNVMYPAAFSDAYLRPEVRLEIGPLAGWMPFDRYPIKPYAAEAFPQLFKQADCAVQAIRAERTFWEKATILHHEANRPESSPQPLRYSRHYYDLAMMAAAPVKGAALADLALLEDVVAFKQRFYRRPWAQYELAKPGTFRLVPAEHVLAAVEKDYVQMRNMIFGRYPDFAEIMETSRSAGAICCAVFVCRGSRSVGSFVMFEKLLTQTYGLTVQLYYFSSWLGWLSAFFVLAISRPPESFLRRVFLWLGGFSLSAPVLLGAIWWILNELGVEMPTDPAIRIWMELWAGGVVFALMWLRVVMPNLNSMLALISKESSLQRNMKTDVRQIEKFLPSAAIKFNPLKFINLSKGIFIGLDEFRKPVYINLAAGASAPHIQAIGTTGAGKGVSLGVMASQFLECGEAVFFCDPKNDEWGPHVLYAAAQRVGKPFHFVNLNRPNGAQFDPFNGATEDEIFELFQAGFSLTEKGDASDFYGIADRREAALTAKLMAAKGLNIAQAYAARQDLMDGAEKFSGRLREMAETPSINALPGKGLDLAKVIEEGGCVYIVGSMRNDLIKTVQRILLVRMLQLAERRDRVAGKLRPVCIVLDEVKYHLSRPALEGLGAARDKGVHLILAHQSLGDLRDCTRDLNPDAVVDAVVENCRKICYRVINPETAEWLAAMSGEIQVDDEIRKVQKNLAQAEIVLGERNIRQAARFFIDVNMLLNLPPKVAVVYGEGLPKFVSIQPLSVAKMPEAVQICIVPGVEGAGSDAIGLDGS